eukprot:471362_1
MRVIFQYTIYLIYLITITTCDILNTINLHGNSSSNDISIINGKGTTVDSAGKWHINVIEQSGSDLAISMNEKWKFDSFKPSKISIIIDGITPQESIQSNKDTDLLILFGTTYDINRHQFFSVGFHLDEARYSYKIYPNTNETLAIGNIKNIIENNNNMQPIDRWQRYSQNNQWVNAIPEYKLAAKWPLYFTIINYPNINKVIYQWRDGINNNNVINVEYLSSFTTQKGLDIYIAGDNINEQLIIKNINITLSLINNENEIEFRNNMNINMPTYMPSIAPLMHLETFLPTIYNDKQLQGMNINVSFLTTNVNNNIRFNETKITFATHNIQMESINKWHIIWAVIGLLLAIFIIVMYMICIVVKGNYECNNNNHKPETNYMKSHSNSHENIPKYKYNKTRESYDMCKQNKNKNKNKRAYTLENIMNCKDSDSDIEIIDIKTDDDNIQQISETNNINNISENENYEIDEKEEENNILLLRNNSQFTTNSQYIAQTIISGNATIGSISVNDELYDLDSMLLSQQNKTNSEWSCSLKLKGDTSYEQYNSSNDKFNHN